MPRKNPKKPNKPVRKAIPSKKPVFSRKPAVKPFSEGKANRYFILFFFIFAFVLYGNTIWNKWAVDDEFVTNNATIAKGFKAIPEIFTTPYVSQSGNIGSQTADYRPIVKLTFAIENQLWGSGKAGRSHAINILIYFALSTLLFFILKRLLRNYNILFPFLITVVFMAHPVHTEVVASLKNRDEMLAFLCGFGALHYFLKYAEKKKIRYFFYALLVFFIGYQCKSSIMPFLVIYPLTLYFFTDFPLKKSATILVAVLVVVLLAYFLPRLFLPHMVRISSYIENPLYFEKNFWLRLGTGLTGLLFYLRILVFPHPLIYYYGYDMIPVTGLMNPWALLSLVIHLGLLIFALVKLPQKHLISFAILFYMIFMAMYSNFLVPVVGIVGERFVFSASVGFCIIVVWLIFKLFSTEPNSLTIEIPDRIKILALVILLLIPAGYKIIKRNRSWRRVYDLYSSDVGNQKRSAKGNTSFAGVLYEMIEKASPEDKEMMVQIYAPVVIEYFKKGLAIYPDNYLVLNDLATVYLKLPNMQDSAVPLLRKAILLNDTLQPAWTNLGRAFLIKKQYDSARYCFEKILKINPNEVRALEAIGHLYTETGDYSKALQFLKRAILLNKTIQPLWYDLGQAFLQKKQYDSALYCFETNIKQNTLDVNALEAIAGIYKEKGDLYKTSQIYTRIGNIYIERKDTAMAVREWEQAEQADSSAILRMKLYDLYRKRGDMYMAKKDTVMAVRFWEQAVLRNQSYDLCMELYLLYRSIGQMAPAKYYYDLALNADKKAGGHSR